MRTQLVLRILAALILGGAYVTSASAQMPGGAFDRLAPGEQKVARSLFDAQRRNLPPGSRLTLDQIAAKRGAEGWGVVFKDMKSQGLVTAKNLGQVVRRDTGRPQAVAHGVVSGVTREHGNVAGIRGHVDDGPRTMGAGGVGVGLGGGMSHGGGRGK